jgi:hypothetical protein
MRVPYSDELNKTDYIMPDLVMMEIEKQEKAGNDEIHQDNDWYFYPATGKVSFQPWQDVDDDYNPPAPIGVPDNVDWVWLGARDETGFPIG